MRYSRKFITLWHMWIFMLSAELIASTLFVIPGYIGYGSTLEWIYLSYLSLFSVWWWFGDFGFVRKRTLFRVFMVSTIATVWVFSHIPNQTYPRIIGQMYRDASVQVPNPSYQSYDAYLAENSGICIVESNGCYEPANSYQAWKAENPQYVKKTIPYAEIKLANIAWFDWFYQFGLIEGVGFGVIITWAWWVVHRKDIAKRPHAGFHWLVSCVPLVLFIVAYLSWHTLSVIALYNA